MPRYFEETEKVKWSVLATRTDDEIIEYFKTAKGQNERYARNSLKFLRRTYGNGAAIPATQPAPAYIPPTPYPSPISAPTAIHTPQPVSATPIAPLSPTAAPDGLGALASLLLPHISNALQDAITRHVAQECEALRSQVRDAIDALSIPQATLIEIASPGEAPRELEGLHHAHAAKIIALANARHPKSGKRSNVMMVGPAGCGKTVIAKSVAQAFNLRCTVVSCSAGMSEAQLLGRLLPLGANGAFMYVESPFMRAYARGGVVLLDEMDAADANLLLVLNAALDNGGIEIEARAASGLDTFVPRHPDCIILAAANTWGAGADTQYMGRGALDAATLERFAREAIDYDHALEFQLGTPQVAAWVHSVREKARNAKIRRVVSTRMILRVETRMAAGETFEQAKASELVSWTSEERAKVGA